ncbi:vacuolar protein sorting-associated protein 33B [Coccinella septempunctata]|uniref:vacuolar protein sorting-associated protein 33B n=1 Tax=Coccinella septempunctata TaxID=41139 RepID=UPI001D0968BC|nr:vacuolar protein sorting-associated protein 33B [Coccinella septempunctata]
MELDKKLYSIQELSKSILSKIFGLNVNSKYLILEPTIIKPLEKICGVKWLRSNGIEKIFKLDDNPPLFDSKAVYYIIYSKFSAFKCAINQIRSSVDIDNPPINKFHVLVMPQSTYIFEKELEEYGLSHSNRDCVVRLHSFQWLPIHTDCGILSLECPLAFSSMFISQNMNYLPMFSKCLWQLLLVLGKANFVIALGQYSNIILSQFDQLCEDKGFSDKMDSEVGGLIILDRNIDYPSALLTPGIYSALLKEIYNVRAGHCEHKENENELKIDDHFNPVMRKGPVLINMDTEQDPVYAMTKNKYFTEVTSVLSNLTKELKMEKLNSKDMSIDEIKKYVQNQLGPTNSRKKIISNHLIAAETIINCLGWKFENLCDCEFNIINNISKSSNFSFLMESTSIENNKLLSLRLFCLILITQNLTESEISSFWEKFLHNFGFKYSYVIQNLINAGIITDCRSSIAGNLFPSLWLPRMVTSQFYLFANRLKQIPPNKNKLDFKYPTCPSYVFRGTYIPLVAQIANFILNSTPLEEIRTKLDGLGNLTIRNERRYPLQTRTLLVYVIGGVTYAEIGALNFVEALTGAKIIVLSDQVISGNDLMFDLLENQK